MTTSTITRHLALQVSLVMLMLAAIPAAGQQISSRGKDFWVAFMPINGQEDRPRYYIIAASRNATVAHITYMKTGRTATVPVPGGDVPARIDLDSTLLEPANPLLAQIGSQSLHVTFDDAVSLDGLNAMHWSGDAFLAIPTPALGMHYLVLAYPNTIDPDPTVPPLGKSDFPSEFTVVATQNGTEVQIDAPVPLNSQTERATIIVTLDAGQIFTGQAKGNTGVDVTGTEITASKPVAVYGGHQRANVPYTKADGRDHMVEQLPPVQSWGQEVVVTPHVSLPRSVPDSSVVRVIAGAKSTTTIKVDGVTATTLAYGQVFELPLDRAKVITADHPILVAEYHGSAVPDRFIKIPTDTIGDPFMMLIPSTGQFDTAYSFESFTEGGFTNHFINVVIPKDISGPLRLDDSTPAAVDVTPVAASPYVNIRFAVAPGFHRIHAPIPFGVTVYGYGPYTAYGYPAGALYPRAPLSVPGTTAGADAITMRAVPDIINGTAANLEIDMPRAGDVSIAIHNATGDRVRALPGMHLEAGKGSISLDFADLASGVYYCRLHTASGASAIAKLVVVR